MINRKYVSNKKNKGIVPQPKDKRVLYVPVGCGKCMECLKQKARSWQVRLGEEIRSDNSGKFVTLTFSEDAMLELGSVIDGLDGYDLDNEIATIGVRRFLERWRKKHKKSVKHWFVTELGGTSTERLHIHGIMWTNAIDDISRIWKYGIVTIGRRRYLDGVAINDGSLGYVSERSVNYIVKYISKTDKMHNEYLPKMLVSPGIGKGFLDRGDFKLNSFKGSKTNEAYKTRTGVKLNLPIYYRNKIYSEDEREKLWLDKLDKKVRFVDGNKVSVKDGDKDYYKVLEVARNKNTRLGYGDDSINWDRRKYEADRRNMLKMEREYKAYLKRVKFGDKEN